MENERRLVSPILDGNGSFPNETGPAVLLPKPIEIFPGPQEIQTQTFKKTPLMFEAEQVIQEDLQVFLSREYSEKLLSTTVIYQMIRDTSGGNIKVRASTINDWLRKHSIPVRSREEGAKLVWQDPERRERRIESMHSPMAERKRSETKKRDWQNLSKAERRHRLRGTREERRRRTLLRRMIETLGENPAERLKEMHWQEGLSPTGMAKELGAGHSIVITWMKNFGIEIRKPGQNLHGSIRAKKEEKQNLIEQARAKGHIEMLPAKEQFVINARFPTEGTTVPLTQIGQKLDPNRPVQFSREYIRQIQEKALRKLANGAK